MSNNLLSKNHPFRASVTHGSAEIVSPSETIVKHEEQEKSKLTFSPKTKITCFAIVGLIATYGWLEVYDSIYPETKNKKNKQAESKISHEEISHEEIADFEWGISNHGIEEDTVSQPSWFKQTFCKGVKRSIFCR